MPHGAISIHIPSSPSIFLHVLEKDVVNIVIITFFSQIILVLFLLFNVVSSMVSNVSKHSTMMAFFSQTILVLFLFLNVVSSMVSNLFKLSTMMASLFFLTFFLVFIIFFFWMMLVFMFVYRVGSNTPNNVILFTSSSFYLLGFFIYQFSKRA